MRKGSHHSEETRRKMSETRMGKRMSEETKRKMSEMLKGDKNPNYGKHPSEETRKKISEANKGQVPWNKDKHHSEETRRKMRENHADFRGDKNPNFGKQISEETRKKMREAQKGEKGHNFGKHLLEETRRKMSEAQKGNKKSLGKHPSERTRRKMSEAQLGKHPSEETRQKLRETTKKNWRDPNFVKKVFDGLNAKPNGLEKKVGTILQKHLPEQYAYNGDFSCGITIGGKIPDFVNVNGEKVVIEVFGPWHDEKHMRAIYGDDISWKRTEFGTKAHYSQFGYKCVVFWQEEIEREDAEQFVLSVLRDNKII
jgi:hypothetical protein